jgi:hypothetical protein
MNKTKNFLATASVIAAIFGASCGGSPEAQANNGKNVVPIASTAPETVADVPESKGTTCRICDYDFGQYKGDLAKAEVDGLLLALNDEYLAYATYESVNRDFNDPRPFVNIQKAEGRHIERLEAVFEAYKLPVPENKWMGDVPRFKSLVEACKAGIAGEIANRDLYTKLFNSTKREDIITVYKALQSASEENHLPAFERCVSGGGRGPGGMNSSRQ